MTDKQIIYECDAKGCEQCSPFSVCCKCKNIACYELEKQEKEFLKTALTDLYTEAITKSEELLLGDFKDYFDTEFTNKLAELIYVNVSNY